MKRFYKDVAIKKGAGGYGITLDGRSVKTPAKAALGAPTKKLAELMAAEWQAQGEEIDPISMPLNRLANTAIDRTSIKKDHVVDEVMGYGRFDQLCFRADAPKELIQIEDVGLKQKRKK